MISDVESTLRVEDGSAAYNDVVGVGPEAAVMALEPIGQASAGLLRPGASWRARRQLGAILIVLGAVSALLVVVAALLVVHNWKRRYVSGGWTQAESSYFGAALAGVIAANVTGLWLWWRAPRMAVGRYLWLAAVALNLWFVGLYWPNRWGMLLWWSIYLFRPALAMVFLGWPTGRPSARVRRWIAGLVAAQVATGLILGLWGGAPTPRGWPRNPLAPFHVGWVYPAFNLITGWLLFWIPALAVIIVLVRRQRGLPAGARRLLAPITAAGVVVAGSDVITGLASMLPTNLTWDDRSNHATVIGAANLTQNYSQLLVATIGICIAFGFRRRAVRSGERHLIVDLGAARPLSVPAAALQQLLGDPSARILYPRTEDTWIDSDGMSVPLSRPHRVKTNVVDPGGRVIAAIETDGRRGVHPSLVEVAAATVSGSIANGLALAVANARLGELEALQHALLDTIDDSRRQLERDLHDRAQQRLVGLALAARLAARASDPESVAAIRREVQQAHAELDQLIDGAVPAPLTRGLGAALMTLAAANPVPTGVYAQGDLGPEDPLARTLWMVASEAVSNAEKHSDATQIHIDLLVDSQHVTLRVHDNGTGGVAETPRSIRQRVDEVCGSVDVVSPTGAGTELTVTCRREVRVRV
jgi:signal transduction histidine kinase